MYKYTVIMHKCMQKHRENTYKSLHNYTMVGLHPPHPATYREKAGRRKEKEGRRFDPSTTSYYI